MKTLISGCFVRNCFLAFLPLASTFIQKVSLFKVLLFLRGPIITQRANNHPQDCIEDSYFIFFDLTEIDKPL